MKKLTRIIVSMVLIFTIMIGLSENASANTLTVSTTDSEIVDEKLITTEKNEDEKVIKPLRTDGYSYWKVTSKSVNSYRYGDWRRGPSGRGPGTITLTNSSEYNFNVTNTISGSYTSVGTIANSLGVTIGKSKKYSAGYIIEVPNGKRYQIIYRPNFKVYKVIETEYYRIDGYDTKTGRTKTAYVSVFSNWDYSWKSI